MENPACKRFSGLSVILRRSGPVSAESRWRSPFRGKELTALPLIPAKRDTASVADTDRYPFSGIHFLASYINCNQERLLDRSSLIDALRKAIKLAGATILDTCEQAFPNGGFTAIVLLAESHASVHTYPEHSSCFIDFFTCGRDCDPAKFDEMFKSYLQPERTTQKILLRSAAD